MYLDLGNVGIKKVSEAARLISTTESDEVVLALFNRGDCTSFSFLLLSQAIKKYISSTDKKELFQLETDGESAYEFADCIGFLKEIGLSSVAYNNDDFLPITDIDIRHRQREEAEKNEFYETGEMVEKISKEIALSYFGKSETAKLVGYLLRESIRNAPEHGHKNVVKVCLRKDDEAKFLEFAVADEGIGIMESLKSNIAHAAYVNSHSEALRWAIKPGISVAFHPAFGQKSRDVWANSGFGLFMISEICDQMGGEFYLASGDACLIKKAGTPVETFRSCVSGTIVGLKIPYVEDSAQNLVDVARNKGENIAKEIKNAFKTASVPSKKLIDLD